MLKILPKKKRQQHKMAMNLIVDVRFDCVSSEHHPSSSIDIQPEIPHFCIMNCVMNCS